jgi:hypothetical protein
MDRDAAVTYVQAKAAADTQHAANAAPTARISTQMLGKVGRMARSASLQLWRVSQDAAPIRVRMLQPELQQTVLEFVDKESSIARTEIASELRLAQRELTDISDDNELSAETERQCRFEIARLASDLARANGRYAQLSPKCALLREKASAGGRPPKRARFNLAKAHARLESLLCIESALQKATSDLDAQPNCLCESRTGGCSCGNEQRAPFRAARRNQAGIERSSDAAACSGGSQYGTSRDDHGGTHEASVRQHARGHFHIKSFGNFTQFERRKEETGDAL